MQRFSVNIQMADKEKKNSDSPIHPPEPRCKSPAGFIIRVLLSIALVWFVLSRTDPSRILQIVRTVNPGYFITAFVLVLSGALPGTTAWFLMCRVKRLGVGFLKLLQLNMIGFFFNSYLPTGLGGHLWRGYTLAVDSDRIPESVASTIVERLTAFASIIVLGAVSMAVNYRTFQKAGILIPVLLVMAVIILSFIAGLLLLPRLLSTGSGLVRKAFPDIPLNELKDEVVSFKKQPSQLALAVLVTSISQATEMAAYAVIFTGMGMGVRALPLMTLVPILRFINHLPISWNSVGAQDLAMMVFWRPMGINAEHALAISLLMHVMRLMVGAVGGLVYWGRSLVKSGIVADKKSR